MDALTRWLSYLSPGLAARRVAGQARLLSAQRYYEAVQSSNYRGRRGGPQSADTVTDRAKGRLREYARWLDENHDLVVGVLDDLVTNIVGSGVGFEPMARLKDGTPAVALNDHLRELWLEFWENPTVTGDLSGPELERLVCRTWLRDGEVFVQHVTNRPFLSYPTDVPYLLEPLESDFIPFDLTTDKITQGVYKNTWGQPTAYEVYKTHPGALRGGASLETKTVPASEMIHLKFCRRLHQTRGVSILHAVLTRLDDIKDYEESERIAARIAAAMTAYIKRNSDYEVSSATTRDGARAFEMAPGMIWDTLEVGEDVGTIKTDRPNPSLEGFRNSQLRAVAAGTRTRFSSIAKNYNGTYSAQRQELVEGSCGYRTLFSPLLFGFYLPIFARLVNAALFVKRITIPNNVVLSSVYRPEIRPPVMPWIDPLKEINAMKIAIEQGIKARHQCIRDTGGEPRIVDQQLASDTFDVRPAGISQNVAPPQDAEAETDLEEAA